MIEVKKKSALPVYGVAAVWVIYCAFFPLYKTWHFIALACAAVLGYIILSAIFPGKTINVEVPQEPLRTGDDMVDALLSEGEGAVKKMRRLSDSVQDGSLRRKLDDIITVIESIFGKLAEDAGQYKQVRRFTEFYLPTTMKLLDTYERFSRSGSGGDNITGTLERIDAALDTILDSYRKFFDSLFEHQALDIETDIRVLETMLKQEGLLRD